LQYYLVVSFNNGNDDITSNITNDQQ